MAAAPARVLLLVGALRLLSSWAWRLDDAAAAVQLDARRGASGQEAQDGVVVAAVAPPAPAPVYTGFERWEMERVKDGPAELPPLRSRPECNISSLSGACLPSFMVVGVQKSGTSTLHGILRTHPQIQPATIKELLFFNQNDRDEVKCDPPDSRPTDAEFRGYLSQFPKAPKTSSSTTLSGEFSATYFHCWCCPESFSRLMPGLRLVVILRDPIERAISRYAEQSIDYLGGVQTYGSFDELVRKELEDLRSCLSYDGQFGVEMEVRCASMYNILGRSLYDAAIASWHKHTDPANLLVTYLEQLDAEPQSVMSSIHQHLGIRDVRYSQDLVNRTYNRRGNYGWSNFRRELGDGNIMRPTLERLWDFYRPHVQRLHEMAKAGLISPLPASWIARWDL